MMSIGSTVGIDYKLACPLASVGGLELKLTFCKLTGADILGQQIEPTVEV
jgi:hypothetical protein